MKKLNIDRQTDSKFYASLLNKTKYFLSFLYPADDNFSGLFIGFFLFKIS